MTSDSVDFTQVCNQSDSKTHSCTSFFTTRQQHTIYDSRSW